MLERFKIYRDAPREVQRLAAELEETRGSLRALRERAKQQREQLEKQRGRIENKDKLIETLKARSARQTLLGAPIFFLVGASRSGTNWLMRTLNAHPEIMCRGEGRSFGRKWRREIFRDMSTSEHIKHKVQPTSLYNAIAEDEYLRLWVERSVWTRDLDTDEQMDLLVGFAVRHFLTGRLRGTRKRIVGDKTPLGLNGDIVEEVGRLMPGAKVIHIIRDGRDRAISRLHHKWNRVASEGGLHELSPEEILKRDHYRLNPERFLSSGESIFSEDEIRDAAEDWKQSVSKAREQGVDLHEHYAEVRYEDLLERPEKEFGRLFRFLGARDDEETVARCVEATSFEKRAGGRSRGQEDSRSGVRKGIAGDWKNVFTERDRAIFEEEAADLLVELGYEKDDW